MLRNAELTKGLAERSKESSVLDADSALKPLIERRKRTSYRRPASDSAGRHRLERDDMCPSCGNSMSSAINAAGKGLWCCFTCRIALPSS